MFNFLVALLPFIWNLTKINFIEELYLIVYPSGIHESSGDNSIPVVKTRTGYTNQHRRRLYKFFSFHSGSDRIIQPLPFMKNSRFFKSTVVTFAYYRLFANLESSLVHDSLAFFLYAYYIDLIRICLFQKNLIALYCAVFTKSRDH